MPSEGAPVRDAGASYEANVEHLLSGAAATRSLSPTNARFPPLRHNPTSSPTAARMKTTSVLTGAFLSKYLVAPASSMGWAMYSAACPDNPTTFTAGNSAVMRFVASSPPSFGSDTSRGESPETTWSRSTSLWMQSTCG